MIFFPTCGQYKVEETIKLAKPRNLVTYGSAADADWAEGTFRRAGGAPPGNSSSHSRGEKVGRLLAAGHTTLYKAAIDASVPL